LEIFRKDVESFVRLYDFMSQIIDYADTDLERRSIFFRLLARQIQPQNQNQPVDLSAVDLAHIKQKKGDTQDITLGGSESKGLRGITAVGSGAKRDPKLVKLEEILKRLNELFSDEDFARPSSSPGWRACSPSC
jgi:type I restriction enzyme, R subunit